MDVCHWVIQCWLLFVFQEAEPEQLHNNLGTVQSVPFLGFVLLLLNLGWLCKLRVSLFVLFSTLGLCLLCWITINFKSLFLAINADYMILNPFSFFWLIVHQADQKLVWQISSSNRILDFSQFSTHAVLWASSMDQVPSCIPLAAPTAGVQGWPGASWRKLDECSLSAWVCLGSIMGRFLYPHILELGKDSSSWIRSERKLVVVAFLDRVGRERVCACGGIGDAFWAGGEGRLAISLFPSFPFQFRGVIGTCDVSWVEVSF